MSKIGEIRKGKEIGKSNLYADYMWQTCPNCGKERWRELRGGKCRNLKCRKCSDIYIGLQQRGENHPNWGGGKWKRPDGYVLVLLQPDDFFYPMARKSRYVLEHRLVVARALGRCLHSWEIVHHKEGFAKDDNRYPETLQLVTDNRHKQITVLGNRIKRLEQRILLLEVENILLCPKESNGFLDKEIKI